MEPILDAKQLAAYIAEKYKNKYGNKISPVRLQKTLYFCFAYWGGFIRRGKLENASEIDVTGLSEILFKDSIEAWVYGPVIPDVYHNYNSIERYTNTDIFKNKNILKEFIDNVIEDTFEINDFRLVDISHRDQCWKNNFDYDEKYHNSKMDKEEIINEYARK